MKSMFYVGAALMLGASVYGFVDYRQSKSKKEFKELYTKTATTDEVAKPGPAESDEIAPQQEQKAEVAFAGDKKSAKVEKTKAAAIDEEALSKAGEIVVMSPEKPVVKKSKQGKKKKLNYKLFSRAAPREIIEPEPAKAEKH